METLIKAAEVVTDGIFRPSNITTNFDQNLLAPFIGFAEEGFTIRVLGVSLYNDMVLNQNPAPSNYNPAAGPIVQKFPTAPNYEELWTKYLLRYSGLIVVNYSLPFIGLQTSSQGVLLKNTEFAENAGIEGVKYLQDQLQKTIDDMEPRINSFLCDNKGDFLEFDSDTFCKSCNSGEYCNCGYYEHYKKTCPKCIKGRDSSTKIIFY